MVGFTNGTMRVAALATGLGLAGTMLTGCITTPDCSQGLGTPDEVIEAFTEALESGDASEVDQALSAGPYGTSTDIAALAEELGPTSDYAIGLVDSQIPGTYYVNVGDARGGNWATFEIYELADGEDNPQTPSACYDAAWGDATADPSATPSVAD